MTLVGCWVHAYRGFFDVLALVSKRSRNEASCWWMSDKIEVKPTLIQRNDFHAAMEPQRCISGTMVLKVQMISR